jgi:hypothetical protein
MAMNPKIPAWVGISSFANASTADTARTQQMPKRIKFVRCAHPTRNGEAPLLAAYARRYIFMKH